MATGDIKVPKENASGTFDEVVLSSTDIGAAPATGIDPTAITGTAVVDSDARLSDSRSPTDHAASHAAGNKATFSGSVSGMTANVLIRADDAGTAGNSITLTFDGINDIDTVLSTWNAANISNQASLILGDGSQVPDNGEQITLSGGVASGSDPFKNINQNLGTEDAPQFLGMFVGDGAVDAENIGDATIMSAGGIALTMQSPSGNQVSMRWFSPATTDTGNYWAFGCDTLNQNANNFFIWDFLNNRPALWANGNTGNVVFGGEYAEGTLPAKVQVVGISPSTATLLGLDNKTAGAVAMQIRAAVSQSANLTEWLDSNDNVVAAIDAGGNISAANLGTAATADIGTGAGDVCAGDDARLSDSRTPSSHASSHAPSGSDPLFDQDLNTTDSPTFGVVTVGEMYAEQFVADGALNDPPTSDVVDFTAQGISFQGTAAATTRANLGLGDSATADIGTAAGEVAAGDHGHGNLTTDGKIGSTAGLPVVTTTAGAVTTLALGTANQVLKVNSGATGVEFGTVDSVDDYTVITTGQTAANGDRIAADTTASAFTLTLPATPSNGDTIYILDYAGTFDTNNLTLGRNGSNIEGLAEDMTCNVEGSSFKMVYTGATNGWQMIPYYGTGVNIGGSAADVLSVSSGELVADDAGADRIVFWDDSESKLRYLEAGSGLSISGTTLTATASGGSKTYAVFSATDNQPPATAFATYDTRSSIAVLDFDDATDESAVFVSIMPEGASLGSGLKIRLHWMATTATSGNVVWDVSLERMTTDLDADSFDTIASGTAAANGTSGILTVTEITLTTIDSVTAGDGFRLKVTRDANNASDTMTGDAELVVCEVRSAA